MRCVDVQVSEQFAGSHASACRCDYEHLQSQAKPILNRDVVFVVTIIIISTTIISTIVIIIIITIIIFILSSLS